MKVMDEDEDDGCDDVVFVDLYNHAQESVSQSVCHAKSPSFLLIYFVFLPVSFPPTSHFFW